MKLLFEDSMPYAEAFFSGLAECESFSHKTITPEKVSEADILLVRSTTKVNQALLSKAANLRYVSTATAGTNHMDQQYLRSQGIAHGSAGGCNAVAVAEYVLSAMLVMAEKLNWQLCDKTVGIVGAGHVGTRLTEKLDALGMDYLLCDPPLAEQGDSRSFSSLEQVLACDIISLHVPLVEHGSYPTGHLIDKRRLAALSQEQLLINACRGEVLDNQAALELFRAGKKMNLVLDVWENEPQIDLNLVPYIALATAHIAGHTIEGKARGTEMLYQQVCQLLKKQPELSLADFLPAPTIAYIELPTDPLEFSDLKALLLSVYDIRNDDPEFKKAISQPGQFAYIRKHYAIRREFAAIQVSAGNCPITKAIYKLGFKSL
jgi:erythronate-4-phosphate dehydrogenase